MRKMIPQKINSQRGQAEAVDSAQKEGAMRSFLVSSGSVSFTARHYAGVGAAFRCEGYAEQSAHDQMERAICGAVSTIDADSRIESVNITGPDGREWNVRAA